MIKTQELNPLALAYLGDAVYELWVRSHLLEQGIGLVQVLHKKATDYVRAGTQAEILHRIMPELSEEENQVVLRGRNAKGGHPRNVDVVTYRHATGFEALVGYWHLQGKEERLEWVFNQVAEMMDDIEDNDGKR